MITRSLRHSLCTVALALACATGTCASDQRGVPASNGIKNFGKVSDTLYRGAQPDETGLENLRRLGIKTIIDFRMPGDTWAEEAAAASRHGLKYINVPLHGFSAPTDAEVARVLSLIASLSTPVYIHCEHGADRTGTIVACYRIRVEGWASDRALTEARLYGLSEWEFGMKHFVRDFPAGPPAAGTTRR